MGKSPSEARGHGGSRYPTHGEYFWAMMLGMRGRLCGGVGGGRKGKGEATEATVPLEPQSSLSWKRWGGRC